VLPLPVNSALQSRSLPNRPLTPLFATLTNHPQLAENPTALSPLLATHTDFSPVTPAFATHTKTTGVHTNSSHFETEHPSRMRVLSESMEHSDLVGKDLSHLLQLTAFILVLSFHSLTNCPSSKLFVLTSIQMPRGYGGIPNIQTFKPANRVVCIPIGSGPSNLPHPSLLRHSPSLCYHPASQPGRCHEL
jgi:hypothetical protein